MMKAYGITTLAFVCLVLVVQTQGRWMRSRRSSTSRKNGNIQSFLDGIFSETQNDPSLSECEGNFVEERGSILRTKDSLDRGAEFIEAPADVDNALDCKEACCKAVTSKDSRHCDLAVFQQNEVDVGRHRQRCFLFSCLNDAGKDVCETADNEDYRVFRLKKKNKVEDQLLNIVTNLTSVVPNHKKSEIEEVSHPEDCTEKFSVKKGFIIKTTESIKNGALFLKASKIADSKESCQEQCCIAASKGSSRPCDYAVFQEKISASSMEEAEKSQPRCYLFSCRDDSGDFKCMTSHNDAYSVSQKNVKSHETQLHNIVLTSTETTSTMSSRAKSSTAFAFTSSRFALPTEKAVPVAMTTLETSTTKSVPSSGHAQLNSCGRLMWRCDNEDCVKVTDVCNGEANCVDGSDEVGCESILGDSEKEIPTVLSSVTSRIADPSQATESHFSSVKSTPYPIVSKPATKYVPEDSKNNSMKTEPQKGAVLPLALGLSVTACVLLMVACRFQIMKRKLRKRGKPLTMEESDYLINGMYL